MKTRKFTTNCFIYLEARSVRYIDIFLSLRKAEWLPFYNEVLRSVRLFVVIFVLNNNLGLPYLGFIGYFGHSDIFTEVGSDRMTRVGEYRRAIGRFRCSRWKGPMTAGRLTG